jgi:alkylation response protein AidB-like acyl-CoA dehydrogenase
MSRADAILSETVARLFAEQTSPALIGRLEDGVFPAALWQAIEANGLLDVLRAESGATLADAIAIARLSGRYAVPAPVVETMLARWLTEQAGLAAPPGPSTLAPMAPAEGLPQIVTRDQNVLLDGMLWRVPWARHCASLIVLAHGRGGYRVVLAQRAPAVRGHGQNLAGEPRDDVQFEATAVEADASAAAPDGLDPMALLARAALFRAAQLVGALELALEMSVRYAGERVQFGRPIGRFQAIQHMLAAMAGQVASASAALDAACGLAMHDPATLPVLPIAIAKARASSAAGEVAAGAHQIHGAIGFTREFALQQTTRRLLAWREEAGSEAYWHDWLGRLACVSGSAGLWPLIANG